MSEKLALKLARWRQREQRGEMTLAIPANEFDVIDGMSVEHNMLPTTERRLACLRLVDLGVNVGRMQRDDDSATAAEAGAFRVVIDVHANGAFAVYSDLGVQVICRSAQAPEDQLVQVTHRRIPEEWLDQPVGHNGDGSVADLLAEVIATWSELT